MSIPANFNSSSKTNLDRSTHSSEWEHLGSELVFVQDRSLRYRSFYWQTAHYRLTDDIVEPQHFTPVPPDAYREIIERVLTRQVPEQCQWRFKYRGQILPFGLVISPIPPPQGKAKTVLVMGHRLPENEYLSYSSLPVHPDPYQKLLSQMGQNIRRTLNLETIRLQAVKSLGEALNVSRCLIMSYPNEIEVKAEYCQKPFTSLIGCKIPLQAEPYLKQAILSDEPIVLNRLVPDLFEQRSVLVVATRYQNQCNGLMSLGQCDRYRNWSPAEIELVRELADQIGTAIAHAKIYQELEQATLKAEEASRLKSEFLASTTHELRTPLNGIIGFLKLILDGMADDPQEQQEFLDQAYSSALHLLNLINDILDIAKIEAGKMELELSTVPLDELFRDVAKFTRTQAEKKNLNFKIKLPATYDQVMLYANYQRVLQVMLNLVSNAIKFTHEGEVVISAEIVTKKVKRRDQEFPGLVKISVADTGIGVSLEKQDKLFEKFVQIDGSLTKAYAGTGLGLAISQKLIEAMNGKIYFYSMGEGLGSTVTFTIPLQYVPVIKTAKPGHVELVTPLLKSADQ